MNVSDKAVMLTGARNRDEITQTPFSKCRQTHKQTIILYITDLCYLYIIDVTG